MDEKNIQPADLHNMDETGFRIGIAGAQWVISLSQDRPSYLASSQNRELVADVECVSADGHYLPNMPILQARLHLASLYTSDLNDDTLITFSDSGYASNDLLALKWLHHADSYLRRIRLPSYKRILGVLRGA